MTQGKVIRPTTLEPISIDVLALELGLLRQGPNQVVTGVAVHTDLIAPGDLFVAMPGATRHGVELWDKARASGAVAVMTDPAGYATLDDSTVPVLICPIPREKLGLVSSRVYGTNTPGIPPIFAVTGTNGKTSTVFLLEALMRSLGWQTALSTTAERIVAGVGYASTLTTPEAPDIHAMVALAREKSAGGVALEVSAQALEKNRLDQITVDVAGFTNLSHDHFEDFGGMDRYLQSKAALFHGNRSRAGVVCVDTMWGKKLTTMSTVPVWTIALEPGVADWNYSILESTDYQTTFRLRGPATQTAVFLAPIIGSHMVANAALAVVMLVRQGVSLSALEEANGPGTPGIPVFLPGRIERVSAASGPQVFIDAGRSEDAYRATLDTVRQRTPGRLVMVCGTSGNRDASKRPLMGRAAAELADVVIVTDDDPRREDPSLIREGLLAGAKAVPGAEVHEIPDPNDAISFALSLVGEGDSVVWSGPGSQNYRDIGGVKVPYSARAEARKALALAGWPPQQEASSV
jgi:UDP-N-acetylmuramoyl-L-alanyl-D-glutamate--2,6-diaminopimelate ligase